MFEQVKNGNRHYDMKRCDARINLYLEGSLRQAKSSSINNLIRISNRPKRYSDRHRKKFIHSATNPFVDFLCKRANT